MRSPKPHILCVIASLEFGGAQRALVNMINSWAKSNTFKISLLILSQKQEPAYPVHTSIHVSWLDIVGRTSGFLNKLIVNSKRVACIRKAVVRQDPDLVVSFQDETNVMVLLALIGRRIPVVCSERIHPAYHPIGTVWSWLRPKVYPMAAAVVVQGTGIAQWFSVDVNTVVIPNSVQPPRIGQTENVTGKRKRLLGVGRLHWQKGFDVLLNAFASIASQYPDWDLEILGEGELRSTLYRQAESLGISDRCKLSGVKKDMAIEYQSADAFVLSSRYEGFPNVLVEAMSYGVAVVATTCPGAVVDIVTEGKDGLLVEVDNINDLAEKLSRIMGEDELRQSLGSAAKDVVNRFDEQRLLGKWEHLIRTILLISDGGQ